MKKEKHKWRKEERKTYFNFIGDSEHHHILEEKYYICTKCGVIKLKLEENEKKKN